MIDLQRFMRASAKDLSGVMMEYVRKQHSQNVANSFLAGNLYLVPADRLLVVNQCTISVTPGAAQFYRGCALTHFAEKAFNVGIHYGDANRGAGLSDGGVLIYPGVILPPGQLTYTATFDAGVAANQVFVDIYGWLIPRGSVAV